MGRRNTQVQFACEKKGDTMTLAGKVWKNLDENDRYLLLSTAYPKRSDALLDLESQKEWNELLPSTQQDLENVDFCGVLRRDVQP